MKGEKFLEPSQIGEDVATADVDVLDAEVGEVHLADVGEVGRVEALRYEVLRQSTSERVLRRVALRRLLNIHCTHERLTFALKATVTSPHTHNGGTVERFERSQVEDDEEAVVVGGAGDGVAKQVQDDQMWHCFEDEDFAEV